MDDSDLSLQAYWLAHCRDIAVQRKWKNPKATTAVYNYCMRLMATAAPEIITQKPFVDVTMLELTEVLTQIQRKREPDRQLRESTITGCVTLIHNILGHAMLRGLPTRALNRFENKLISKSINRLCEPAAAALSSRLLPAHALDWEETLEEECAQKQNIRKSLTTAEMQLMIRHISAHLLEDGRYIGLAIMMYTGLRPGECRALRWEDFHTVQDSDGVIFFEIHHTLDRNNKEIDWPKTANGIRNVPIHCELSKLLARWRKHIQQALSLPLRGTPPVREMPRGYIICAGREYGKPCSYQAFSDFAKRNIFHRLSKDVRAAVECEITLVSNTRAPFYDPDDNLSLYVLRRNFWTWIQYGTSCTRMEKLYIMGHKMEEGGCDVRPQYSTIQALIAISKKLNEFTILPEYHRRSEFLTSCGEMVSHAGMGCMDLRFPLLLLKESMTVRVHLQSTESNDCVEVELLSPSPNGQPIPVSCTSVSMDPPKERYGSLITESATLRAIDNTKKASAPESDS